MTDNQITQLLMYLLFLMIFILVVLAVVFIYVKIRWCDEISYRLDLFKKKF